MNYFLRMGLIGAGLCAVGVAIAFATSPRYYSEGKATPYVEDGYALPKMPTYLQGPVAFEPRFGCAWNRPGRNRFTGDKVSALAAVGLPEGSRVAAMRAIQAHTPTDRVRATNGSVMSLRYHERFDPRSIGMTFGDRTLCYNTTPTFTHEEFGDLYIVDNFYIVIWDVCGNISRVVLWEENRAYAQSKRPSVFPAVPRYGQPYYPGEEGAYGEGYPYGNGGPGRGRRGKGGNGTSAETNDVPEPETLLLIAPFLLLLLTRKRK